MGLDWRRSIPKWVYCKGGTRAMTSPLKVSDVANKLDALHWHRGKDSRTI